METAELEQMETAELEQMDAETPSARPAQQDETPSARPAQQDETPSARPAQQDEPHPGSRDSVGAAGSAGRDGRDGYVGRDGAYMGGDGRHGVERLALTRAGTWVSTVAMVPRDGTQESILERLALTRAGTWVSTVVDGEAEKPDDLDDAEDGEWEALTKDNPEYKSDTSVGESANFTVVESVESATASTDQPMDPAEAYVYAPVDTLRHRFCINGACDRLAAPGYDSCCRPCSDSAGVQHSRRCPQRDSLRCLAFTPKA